MLRYKVDELLATLTRERKEGSSEKLLKVCTLLASKLRVPHDSSLEESLFRRQANVLQALEDLSFEELGVKEPSDSKELKKLVTLPVLKSADAS